MLLVINSKYEISFKENKHLIKHFSTKSKGDTKDRKYVIRKDNHYVYGINYNAVVATIIFTEKEVADNKCLDLNKETKYILNDFLYELTDINI